MAMSSCFDDAGISIGKAIAMAIVFDKGLQMANPNIVMFQIYMVLQLQFIILILVNTRLL